MGWSYSAGGEKGRLSRKGNREKQEALLTNVAVFFQNYVSVLCLRAQGDYWRDQVLSHYNSWPYTSLPCVQYPRYLQGTLTTCQLNSENKRAVAGFPWGPTWGWQPTDSSQKVRNCSKEVRWRGKVTYPYDSGKGDKWATKATSQ